MQQEDLIQDVNEYDVERDAHEELGVFGTGNRRLQILKMPASGEGWAWEFYFTEEDGWVVSRSKAWLEDGARPRLSGFERLRLLGDALMGIHQKITSVSFPMFIPPEPLEPPTGVRYDLAVWGGEHQTIRMVWWNDAPSGGWQEFTNYIQECIYLFESLQVDERFAY